MSEAKKRKVYLQVFKARVVLEAVRGVKTVNQIGQEFGVHPVQVSQWKAELQAKSKRFLRASADPNLWQLPARPSGFTAKLGD